MFNSLKAYLLLAGVIGLMGLVGFGWYEHRELKDARAALKTAQAAQALCEQDKHLTYEAANDYQKQVSALSNELGALKRVRPATCVPVTRPAAGVDATACDGRHAAKNGQGVTSDFLLDYGAECEGIGRQLDALQAFVNALYKSRGQ